MQKVDMQLLVILCASCHHEKSREPRMTENAAALAEEHSQEHHYEHFWFRAGAPQTPTKLMRHIVRHVFSML